MNQLGLDHFARVIAAGAMQKEVSWIGVIRMHEALLDTWTSPLDVWRNYSMMHCFIFAILCHRITFNSKTHQELITVCIHSFI